LKTPAEPRLHGTGSATLALSVGAGQLLRSHVRCIGASSPALRRRL
jgi:hypothetical protein